MENETQEFKSPEKHTCNCDKENWLKFALLALALFLGSYLATYFVVDQSRHAYYIPNPRMMDHIRMMEQPNFGPPFNRMMDDTDKLIEDLDRQESKMMKKDFGVSHVVQTFKSDDAYKIVINLKPFGNNIENIKLDIASDRISITGQNDKVGKKRESKYMFSQSFTLPEEIDTSKVVKKKVGHKYIITLPILNDED